MLILVNVISFILASYLMKSLKYGIASRRSVSGANTYVVCLKPTLTATGLKLDMDIVKGLCFDRKMQTL